MVRRPMYNPSTPEAEEKFMTSDKYLADNRPRHRFSVADYQVMIEHAILIENDRVELIRGVILEKPEVGGLHMAVVMRLNRFLVAMTQDRGIFTVNNPIRLADSMPEPDVAVLQLRADLKARGTPTPADVFLLIEVADTSAEYDREENGPLYAENGIVEYWIVNIEDQCLEVHRQPRPDGTNADVRTLRAGETVEVTALPGVSLPVAELF